MLNKLLKSLEEKYQEDIKLCHTSSSFIYESVEELNIHFYKINLQRGASYIYLIYISSYIYIGLKIKKLQ